MNFIVIVLVLLFGFTLKYRFKALKDKDFRLVDFLWMYHLILATGFYFYILTFGGDSYSYWYFTQHYTYEQTLLSFQKTGSSTFLLRLINYYPANLLDLSFFTGTMIYATLGYWGFLYLVLSIKELFPLYRQLHRIKIVNISIFPIMLFLPNLHFWSSGVGKDSVVFFAVCMFIYGVLQPFKRWYLILIAAIISYGIRPHMTLFLFSGFGAAYILLSKIPMYQKVMIIMIAGVAFFPLLGKVLEFAKIEEASIEAFSDFSQNKAGALSRTAGSAVNLAALPYPLQVLTFLFRPLFFDANNIFALFSSIENVIWITLTVNFIRNKPMMVFRKSNFAILGAFLYWLIGALAFAPVMGNLGIIIRERNMMLPAFLLFSIAGLAQTKQFRKFTFYYRKEEVKYKQYLREKVMKAKELTAHTD
ncbi:MAG: hypothetical protein Q4F57_03645 [Weeksellaceae bacterium]|nr:hypothetical protein [Weeksellaceae bacterium]